MAWSTIATLRKNKVKVEPYIVGTKLLKGRALEKILEEDQDSDEMFHDTSVDFPEHHVEGNLTKFLQLRELHITLVVHLKVMVI